MASKSIDRTRTGIVVELEMPSDNEYEPESEADRLLLNEIRQIMNSELLRQISERKAEWRCEK